VINELVISCQLSVKTNYLGAKIMTIINATPHTITLVSKQGVEQDSRKQFLGNKEKIVILKEIPASGILPRVKMSNEPAEPIDGIPVETVIYGEIEGLPDPVDGTFYIVSGLVAAAASKQGRTDCLAPGAIVRDEANPSSILGCLFLQKP
jgi:hypothetical protein